MLQSFLRKFLKHSPLETDPGISDEQKRVLFYVLWQNPSIQIYLNKRERYLLENSAESLAQGQIPDSKFLAGRLVEIRELRDYIKIAHDRVQKEKEQERARTKVVNT